MKLSYEVIRKIHRLEKQSMKLVKLESDFFDSLKGFLEGEKDNIKQNEDIFDDSKIQRLYNIKNMLEDILYLRQKKIINKAIMKVKTDEDEVQNLLLPEKKMYEDIVKNLGNYQGYIKDIFSSKKPKKNYNLIKVKMIKDVPKFIGTDMQEYGPYEPDEEVEINESISKLFISKGLAEKI